MLTATIQNVLNRGLPRSPRAQTLCAELAGHRVAFHVRDIVRLLVESDGSTLKVTSGQAPADAELTGGPLSLLALAGPDPAAVLQRGDVQIQGDAELAGKFRELAALLRPDPEEELAIVLGDVPAHHIGRLVAGVLGFGQRAASTGMRNLAEYLGHETQDLVPAKEGEQFLRGVDATREDVDRLEARVQALTSRLAAR
jgi:ubiquinone biosynthesis accessory factor UbiJ